MTAITVSRVLAPSAVDALVRSDVPPVEPLDVPPGPYAIRDGDSGLDAAVVVKAPVDIKAQAVAAFRAVPRSTTVRGAGIRTRSNTFGWASPNSVLQRPTPTASAMLRDWPEAHAALERWAAWAWTAMREACSAETVALMESLLPRVHPAYRLGGTPWTSGIANDTVPLQYHHDRNNYPHSWSAMLAARAGIGGGNLHLADYDVCLPIRDGDVVMFPGVDSVHGVTPLRKRLRGGFRYTFVAYTVKALVDCPGPEEAREAAARRRTELEADLLERHAQQAKR